MLDVHLNTLAYRIRRLEELFGTDFEDRKLLQELAFSLPAVYLVEYDG